MSEIHGLEGLSETALRDRYAANTARIAELEALRAAGTLSLADATELRNLALDTNAVVDAVRSIVEPAAPVADLPAVTVPPAPVAGDPVVPPADPDAPPADPAPADDSARAEALAAATALSTAVSTRHDAPAPGGPAVQHQTLVASAAGTNGAITAGAAMTLSDVSDFVNQFAGDKGQSGKSIPIVHLQPALQAAAGVVGPENSRVENTRIFAAQIAQANAALTAAPGPDGLVAAPFEVCGPADILRDVPECDNTQRYVANWFRNIQSTHGQVEFYRAIGMADVEDGVVTWDQEDFDNIDPDDPSTWKPCVEIDCVTTATIGVEEVTQCMTMPVFQSMTSPETVGSAIHAVRAMTARVADGQLLRFYDELASKYTFDANAAAPAGNPFGSTIRVYDLLGRLMGMAAASNRMLDLSGYVLGVEAGFMQHLGLDDASACDSHELRHAARELFGDLGINDIRVTPDWSDAVGAGPWSPLLPINPPASGAIAVPARPTSWRLRLFDPNDFAMLSPGGDTFGIVPDLANKRQNKVTWFGSLYQGLGKLGCKPAFSVSVTDLISSGARSACIAYA